MSNNKRQFRAEFEYQDEDGFFESDEIAVEAANQSSARDIALDRLQSEWFLSEGDISYLSVGEVDVDE